MFKHALEALPGLVWMCRADGFCGYLSPKWTEYTGVPEHELHGVVGWQK